MYDLFEIDGAMPAVFLTESSLPILDAHLEACGLVDRLPALQQILATPSEPQQHVLILGEQGIGKTAFLRSALSFIQHPQASLENDSEKSSYCWTASISLSQKLLQSPYALLKAVLKSWQEEAHLRLAAGLADANRLLAPLDLKWSQEDLIRAITLMRLQWDMDQLGGAVEMLPKQRLANAIRSAMPFSKKIHFSAVNHGVRQLVERLTDPWLAIAAQWVEPVHSEIAEALALLEEIEPLKPPAIDTEEPHAETNVSTIAPYLPPETLPLEPIGSLRSVDEAIQTVIKALRWINDQLLPHQTGTPPNNSLSVVVAVDGLEALALCSPSLREIHQKTLHTLIVQSGHQWWLTCDSSLLSKALAGPLLRQPLAYISLEPLSLRQQRRWLTQSLTKQGFGWEDAALEKIALTTQGNPFWLQVASQCVIERLQATDTQTCTLAWVSALGIETAIDWLEMAWARALMILEPLRETCFAEATLEPMQWQPLHEVANILDYSRNFSDDSFWQEDEWLSKAVNPQPLTRRLAIAVMAALIQFGFILPQKNEGSGSFAYRWMSKTHHEFLLEKTRWVRSNLPNDATLAYLQKIIPLSAQAGELDGLRVSELLALAGQSINSADLEKLYKTLESALLHAACHSQPAQRLMALEGLAQLASPLALEALKKGMNDPHATVKEYALRYWSQLIHSPVAQTFSNQSLEGILTALTPCLDDEQSTVRWWGYSLASASLISHPFKSQCLPLFLKGTLDKEPAIRLLAIRQLGEFDIQSAQVRQSLMTLAQTDTNDSIRYEACKSLQRQPHPKVVETLLGVLEHDTNSRNRSLAIQLLSHYPDPLIAETFQKALISNDSVFSDDVRLTLIRSLKRFPGKSSEEVLQILFQKQSLPTELLWSIIRTLHDIGKTPESLTLLKNYFSLTKEPTLKMACLSASQAIAERLSLAEKNAIDGQASLILDSVTI